MLSIVIIEYILSNRRPTFTICHHHLRNWVCFLLFLGFNSWQDSVLSVTSQVFEKNPDFVPEKTQNIKAYIYIYTVSR